MLIMTIIPPNQLHLKVVKTFFFKSQFFQFLPKVVMTESNYITNNNKQR